MKAVMQSFWKRYARVSVGVIAVGVAAIAGGCMNESFYSNTKRFDTYAQQGAADKMDFLWLIDNSPTMTGKISFILNNVNAVMSDIVQKKDLDWTSSIITTDLTFIGGSSGTYGLHSGAVINNSVNQFCTGPIGTVCNTAATLAPISIDRLPYVDAWLDAAKSNTTPNEFCQGDVGACPNPASRFAQQTYAGYDAYRYKIVGSNEVPAFPAPFRTAKGRPQVPVSDPAYPLTATPGGGLYAAGIAEFQQMLLDFNPTDCNLTSAGPGVTCGSMNTPFAFWEEGLEYIYKMLVDPTLLASISRTGVPLTIIVISDSNDYSCDASKDPNQCSGGQPQFQNPQPVYFPLSRYVNLLTNVKKSENSYVNLFAVVSTKSEDANSPGSGGCFAEAIGDRYISVANSLGEHGFVENVCTLTGSFVPDSGVGLANVSAILRDRGSLFPLSSIPDGYDGLSVIVNGKQSVPNADYVLQMIGDKCFIKFLDNIPQNDSDVSIDYQSGQTAGSCP